MLKKIIKKPRVIVLLIMLVLSLVAIQGGFIPQYFREGVAIRSVAQNSSASLAGVENPSQRTPMSREIIEYINNKAIENVVDYSEAIEEVKAGIAVQIKTNKGSYRLIPKPVTKELNETETVIVEEIDENNNTINVTKQVPKTEVIGIEDLGLRVYDAPTTNIRQGLDLSGGTRILLQPEQELDDNDFEILIANMEERLNVYGLSDIVIRQAGDLSGNQFILVEIAGASDEEVKDLLAKQGKFEARVGNETVFRGGQDVTYVCRSAQCAGIDPNYGCRKAEGNQYVCRFRFSISLSQEAAERQANVTSRLEVITEDSDQFLSEKLVLMLDDKDVDELRIAADLKGKAEQQISITGSGVGNSEQEAAINALNSMKKLQTVLITGSLPVKLNIVQTNNISALLGVEFVKNALLIGLLAIISVGIAIFIRYRKWQIALPIMITNFSEVIILLGIAAVIGWNIDLAAIAGIIIAVGTGVDHLVVITDETIRGEREDVYNWKKSLKNAFFIIMAAYFTTVVAMLPLVFAGAGLLKGFAITTIIGVSVGVFITRPAYAAAVEVLLKK